MNQPCFIINFKKPVLIVSILVTLSLSIFSQSLGFHHITNENGLSSNAVLSITQDKTGFMWFGTPNGLNRYDGNNIKTYFVNKYKNQNLAQTNIFNLITDSDNTLWAGTSNGLHRYIPDKDAFEPFSIPGIRTAFVTYLYEDQKKNLWVGTAHGLFLLNAKRDTTKMQAFFSNSNAHSIAGNYIKCIYEDHTGSIWIGTISGLTQIQLRNGNWHFQNFHYDPARESGISANYITSIIEDGMQGLWIGTLNNGVNRYEFNTGRFSGFKHINDNPKSIINNNIRQIAIGPNGHIWIGTQEGLSIIDPVNYDIRSFQHEPGNKKSLNQHSIYSIFQDAAKSMWVGTYFGGANINYSTNTFFTLIQNNEKKAEISSNVVSSIVEDAQKNLWIGTEGGGLNTINSTTGKLTVYKNNINDPGSISSNLIKSVYYDRDNLLWIGTAQGGGLNNFDPKTGKFRRMFTQENYESDESFSHAEVQAIFEDSYKRLWLGTTQGIQLFQKNKATLIPFNTPLFAGTSFQILNNPLKIAKSFFEDQKKQLWIGTTNGLYRVKGDSIKEINDVDYINCITGDAKGNIWLGLNYGGGLGFFNHQNDRYSHYNDNGELAEKTVVGILTDKENNLWLSTDKGLVRFNPASKSFQTYTSSDGIAANDFNNNAFFKDSKGMLYFGGYKGITSFFPKQIETNTEKAQLVFTGLKLFNERVEIGDEKKLLKKNITLTNEIILRYNQNVLTFEFALLNFIKSNKNKYRYKLEGFDKDWLQTNTTAVSYNNLPPGSYRLILKGANNDGIWSEPLTMNIRVLPPFWLTWWAYCIYTLAALMIIFFVYRFFFLRALLVKEEELHQVKLNFFTNVSHEILTHLTLIMAPVEKMLESNQPGDPNNEKLTVVKNNAAQLLRLVKELMDFRKAETNHLQLKIERHNLVAFLEEIYTNFLELSNSKNINLTFIHEREDIFVYFDPEQLEKVCYNLLTNALKFTPEGGHIEILVVQNDNVAKISVCDNGRGIHPQYIDKIFTNFFQVSDYGRQNTGYGIGLALSKNIIELHKGSITVQSEPACNKNEGRTCFTVILQLGNKHLVNGTNKDDLVIKLENPLEINAVPSVNKADETDIKKTFSILIAEDNPDLLQLLKDTFEKQYAVQVCSNGLEAWERSITEIPDLVVSDVMMPEMDGFDLCEKLKTDERTSHIPVILLTAKTTQDDQIAGLETGADIYITKPYSPKILELNIRNLLVIREKLRQRFGRLLVSAPKKENETVASDNFVNAVDKEFYDKVVELIHEHLDDPEFGVSMLSRKVAMSAPILYKKLKALTDMSVNDFVKSIRMKKAAELLMKKDLTVSEIAFMVGYNDRKYFSREFKKQYGKSPSVFADSGFETTPAIPLLPDSLNRL